jgi:hypothetical protein
MHGRREGHLPYIGVGICNDVVLRAVLLDNCDRVMAVDLTLE